jgi:uncharacterized repeat protein (TIGR01451 family)
VSLSGDGNTAIVGGDGDNSGAGAAWVFTRSGGVWTQQGPKLVGSAAVGNAAQGKSVSLSADGNTAIVGGYVDNGGAGAAWVWTRNGGSWTQQGNKLTGSALPETLGFSVALSGDGNTALLGSPEADSVWIWTRSGGVWTQQGPTLVDSGNNTQRGWSVSLSADGNTAAVAAARFEVGVDVWTRSAGVWVQQPKLFGSGALVNGQQGAYVALAANGNTAIAGLPWDNSQVGAAWIFQLAPADLSITKSLNGGPVFLAGANLSYAINVANNGPGSANSVAVTDTLPAGTTFVSATPSQGSCSGTTTVSCAVGTLSSGGSATITLVLTTASTPGVVSNTATVSATQTDPNPANNSFTSAITTINPSSIPASSLCTLIALGAMLALVGAMSIRD